MTKTKRPYAQPNPKRVNIYTDGETLAELKRIGNGNVSAAIRLLVAKHKKQA